MSCCTVDVSVITGNCIKSETLKSLSGVRVSQLASLFSFQLFNPSSSSFFFLFFFFPPLFHSVWSMMHTRQKLMQLLEKFYDPWESRRSSRGSDPAAATFTLH